MMRTLIVTAAAAVLALAACSSPEAPRGAPASEAAGCPAGFVDTINAWGETGFNGSVAMVTRDGSCVTAAGLRDRESGAAMSPDTVFAIGSVSKSFTAAAVVKLVADRRLALDDTAGAVLPGLRGPAADATIDQLLTHTSGLHGNAGEDHRPLGRAAAVAAIGDLPRTFPAGRDFGYTNAGYTLLALIIDQVTGNYRQFMATEMLRATSEDGGAGFWDGKPAPIGPRAVGYIGSGRSEAIGDFLGPHWAMSGNGDLAMSMPTLAAWTADLFSHDLVPRDAVDASRKPRWDHGDGTSETYGWVRLASSVLGKTVYASAGGGGDTGHNVVVAWIPDIHTALAIASSTPELTAEQLLQAIGPALLTGEPIPQPAGAGLTAPEPATVAGAVGEYVLVGGGRFVVTDAGEGVSIAAVGTDAVRALFRLPGAATDDLVRAHEDGVVDLLTGDSKVGDEERSALAEAVGTIRDVELRGTVVDQGELRTYVAITGTDDTVDAWYALDEQGGVAAAEAPTAPPTLAFDRQRGHALVSSDPTMGRPDVRVTVTGGILVLDNGTTTVTARTTT